MFQVRLNDLCVYQMQQLQAAGCGQRTKAQSLKAMAQVDILPASQADSGMHTDGAKKPTLVMPEHSHW